MTREDREDAIDIIQSILDKYEEDECLVTEITIGDEDIKAFKMAIKALEQEPSSSEKPNKSIEEKCPCYHCEYFEIKGWSHCKIHEDAYGDSRCNDYHKVSQDLTKVKQDSNKSEIPTGSNTKNDLGVELIDRAELLKAMDTWDKFGYTARYGLERLDKDDKDFVPYVKYDDMVNCVKNMPPVTPQEPIRPKGKWISHHCGAYYECSNCHERNNSRYDKYCKFCGADMRGEEE